eukprot:PhM_4_TR15159/c0_g1_i1/m.70577/K16197/YWHAB_Q_Z; 14-3-3 protein beta/theta/zeta
MASVSISAAVPTITTPSSTSNNNNNNNNNNPTTTTTTTTAASSPTPQTESESLYRLTAALQCGCGPNILLPSAIAFARDVGVDLSLQERTSLALAINTCVDHAFKTVLALHNMHQQQEHRQQHHSAEFESIWYYECLTLVNTVHAAVEMIQEDLLPTCGQVENECFYLRMLADLRRVLLLVPQRWRPPHVTEEFVEKSYLESWRMCRSKLLPNSVERLGTAVNYATFLLEVNKDKAHTCAFVQKVLGDVYAEGITVSSLPDACRVMVHVLTHLKHACSPGSGSTTPWRRKSGTSSKNSNDTAATAAAAAAPTTATTNTK